MSDRKEIVLIGGKPLHYRVRRNRRARNYKVTVSHDEGVVVVVPRGGTLGDVPALVENWSPWLEQKAEEFSCWEGPRIRQYAAGSEFLFLGAPVVLDVGALGPGRKRPQVDLAGDRLVMQLPAADIWDLRPVLEKWLRKEARREILPRVDDWAWQTDLHPTRVIIGDRKTRWGSCSARGTLSFCYRLVMAPPWVIDAVVVHELCHLRHLNHSRSFYALLDRHCPRHREARNWLGTHFLQVQI